MSSSNRTSSGNRTTSKGGKGSRAENKTHKPDKSDTGKGSDKQHAKGDTHSKNDDQSIKEKVRQLMELSQRSEEEVCLALHECDNDLTSAINMLLEEMGTGEWETRVKKKKNRQASVSKQEKTEETTINDEWNDNATPTAGTGNEKDKSRNKSGPPRLHGRNNDSRGWRGREKQENERNLEESGGRPDFNRDRRGRSGGSTRGPGGGRGRGGGRAGGRFPPRGSRSNSYNKPIDTWDNSNTWDNNTVPTKNHAENWDDFPGPDEWTTEEYTGSLADTKVFTPSIATPGDVANESSANMNMGGIDNAVINSSQPIGQNLQMSSQASQLPSQIAGTLSAAQTQYLSQLTQQNSDNVKQYGTAQTYHAQNSSQVYSSGNIAAPQSFTNQQYGTSPNTYANSSFSSNSTYQNSSEQPAQQPTRTKTQRARVPPPSKIPSSAVEMPGDLNSSIAYLDVQFGVMDFMSDGNSFDPISEGKYGPTNQSGLDNSGVSSTGNLDLNAANQNSTHDAYSPKSNTQSSISSALSQSLSNTDSIPQTSEQLTSAYNSGTRSSAAATPAATPSGLELSKQADSHSYVQPASYNSYQQKTNSYSASTYSGTQTSNSYVSNQANSGYANSQGGTYNTANANTYQNAYSSSAAYQSNTNAASYPSISQANSYPSNNQSFPQNSSQSVYGANAGLNNSSNFGSTTTNQYNSYGSTSNHKLSKDSSYDSSSNAVTTTSNSGTSAAALAAQSTVSVTKSTTTLAAKNSNSVVSNIPPGVTPVMSTPYIMGQVPYFQPPVYSYEEMQMLQQRLPHMTTPYYDMSYQTPTTLAAVRDGALGNVGYSMSDGRFTRGDNNASPVPSTLSQQTSTLTQGHQAQPILAGNAHPYFFTAALNTFPNYQFGTMYTQLPATNAHGSSNSTQYPKPGTYGSGYGNYDTLSQTPDYTKQGYVSNNQGQKSTGGNTSTGSSGNDLSAMYGKSHAALGKVNSYDKQGFHSGTPPPFTGALHAGQNAGLAPSGTGYAQQVYIPTMTPHQQQLSTQLMHQPLHQMDVRHQGRRVDSGNNSGQRSQASNPAKGTAKQPYQTSYWNQA